MMGVIHVGDHGLEGSQVVTDPGAQIIIADHDVAVFWLSIRQGVRKADAQTTPINTTRVRNLDMMTENRGDNERGALIAALGAVLLWSTVATGFKLGLNLLEPLQLLLLATATSAAFFAVAATVRGAWRCNRRAAGRGLLFGLINPLLYYLVLFEAYDRLPAQIAQPLNYTWAITLALLAVPLLRQPLSRRMLVGIGLSYSGVLLLLTQGSLHGLGEVDWLGVALALGSTLLWAGYWLMNARSSEPALSLMAWSFCLALPLVGVACYLGPGWPELSWPAVGFGLWVGLVEMGITFLLWQRALRFTSNAAGIGQLIFLSPFLSLILIGTLVGETIHATSVAGLAVMVAGLLITRRPAPGQPLAKGPQSARTHDRKFGAP
jgi:drug/metabolite transporter (DMT)-like permease